MAYPFKWNPITLGEFIDTCVKAYGARVVEHKYQVAGAFGTAHPSALERAVNGKKLHVVLPNIDRAKPITLDLARNMAARLEIDYNSFGFDFDEENGPRPIKKN